MAYNRFGLLRFCMALVFCLTLWAGTAFGENPSTGEERRSSIHEADGYGYLAGDNALRCR